MSQSLPVYPELLDRDDLNILVLDGGGRGDALAWKLKQSEITKNVLLAPYEDVRSTIKLAEYEESNVVVVGPDKAVADGLVNELALRGIAAFGPTKQAGKIEWYKPKAKRKARKLGIPTPDFQVFRDPEQAGWHIDRRALPMVLKAAGLTRAKGVEVCKTRDEAHKFIDKVMRDRVYGNAGDEVIIEDALDPVQNIEFSMHAITDGTITKPFISSQDYKQIDDHDKGKNTGGMGTIAPVGWLPQNKINKLSEKFVDPMLEALRKDGKPYRGIIYPGIMGDNLLEYNARFGDPEAQVYMRLLRSDLGKLIVATLNNQLDQIDLEWEDAHAICVVLAATGYPDKKYRQGLPIFGFETAAAQEGIEIFHAGTQIIDGRLSTAGGRVLNVTAVGATPEEAHSRAYNAIREIRFGFSDKNMHYRTDIGQRPAPANF